MAIIIVTVTLYRFEPKSLTFKASKRAYGLTILRPLIRFNTKHVTVTIEAIHFPKSKINPIFSTKITALKGFCHKADWASMVWANAGLNGKVLAFTFEMRSLNLEFGSQQIRVFGQKVILQYNVYVILCFFHLLLKYDYVGVYRGFQNLFKKLF